MKFITEETIGETPKQIEKYLSHLQGRMKSLLNNNHLLKSFNLK